MPELESTGGGILESTKVDPKKNDNARKGSIKNAPSFLTTTVTGYAVTFNKRHHRAGHVFQNRYKSIVCEEDPYFLELVRYIHLNPLRAKIVADLERLNRYHWCGHSVLMGTNTLDGQGTDDVLAAFAKNTEVARKEYLKFIADGIPQGRRDELVGGGLKRSRARLPDIDSEPESYDERVLGGGSFVDQLRREEEHQERLYSGMTLSELIDRVEKYFFTEPGQLDRRNRDPIHQKARDICNGQGRQAEQGAPSRDWLRDIVSWMSLF